MVDPPAPQRRPPGDIVTGGRPRSKEELRKRYSRENIQKAIEEEEQKKEEEKQKYATLRQRIKGRTTPTLKEEIKEKEEKPTTREEILKSIFERQKKQPVEATPTKEGVLVTYGETQVLAGREGEVITSGRSAKLRSGFLRRRVPPKESKSKIGTVTKATEVSKSSTPPLVARYEATKQIGLELKEIFAPLGRGAIKIIKTHPFIERHLPESKRIKDKSSLIFDPDVLSVGGVAAVAAAPPVIAGGIVLGVGGYEVSKAIAAPSPRSITRAVVFGTPAAYVTTKGTTTAFKEFQFESLTRIRGNYPFLTRKASKFSIYEPETGAVPKELQTQLLPKSIDILEGTIAPRAEPPSPRSAGEMLFLRGKRFPEYPKGEIQTRLAARVPSRNFEVVKTPPRGIQTKLVSIKTKGIEEITPAKRSIIKAERMYGEGDVRVTAMKNLFRSKKGGIGLTQELTFERPISRFETTTRIKPRGKSILDYDTEIKAFTSGRVITIPVSLPKSKVSQAQKERSKLAIIPLTVQIPKSIADVRPIEDTAQKIVPKLKVDALLEQITVAKTEQRTKSITTLGFYPPSTPLYSKGGTRPPPKPIEEEIPITFTFPIGSKIIRMPKKKKKKKKKLPEYAYNPSIVASAYKIFGKTPKVLTGIRTRPIPYGRKAVRF